jgi:hypothetical protein
VRVGKRLLLCIFRSMSLVPHRVAPTAGSFSSFGASLSPCSVALASQGVVLSGTGEVLDFGPFLINALGDDSLHVIFCSTTRRVACWHVRHLFRHSSWGLL